uniref:Transposase n=1 Tax=Ascaris lumbricoides TaxID=6252 RepID=A0A0M3I516_ASCLU
MLRNLPNKFVGLHSRFAQLLRFYWLQPSAKEIRLSEDAFKTPLVHRRRLWWLVINYAQSKVQHF